MTPDQREITTAIQKQLTTPPPPLELGNRVLMDDNQRYAIVIGLWSDGYTWKASVCFATDDEYLPTDTLTVAPHTLTSVAVIPPEAFQVEILNAAAIAVEEAPPRLNLGQVVKLRYERFGVVIGIDGGDDFFEDGWTYLISYAQPTADSIWHDYEDLEPFVLSLLEEPGTPLLELTADR